MVGGALIQTPIDDRDICNLNALEELGEHNQDGSKSGPSNFDSVRRVFASADCVEAELSAPSFDAVERFPFRNLESLGNFLVFWGLGFTNGSAGQFV